MRIAPKPFCALCLLAGFTAQAMAAEYLEGTARQKSRAYSPAVITEGGRTVWLAGQTATVVNATGTSVVVSNAADAANFRPGDVVTISGTTERVTVARVDGATELPLLAKDEVADAVLDRIREIRSGRPLRVAKTAGLAPRRASRAS